MISSIFPSLEHLHFLGVPGGVENVFGKALVAVHQVLSDSSYIAGLHCTNLTHQTPSSPGGGGTP